MLLVVNGLGVIRIVGPVTGGPNDHVVILGDRLLVADVSGLDLVLVAGVVYPHSIEDVQYLVRTRSPISVRGKGHSMGGHTLVAGGYQLDMRHMTRLLHLDVEKRVARVEAGMEWSALIRLANLYGLSPMTLQSYSSFSIGGSISVNAHGVTNDWTVARSVISLDLVLANGTLCTCRVQDELCRLAIGGYGMFGVIVTATLRLVHNEPYDLVSSFHSLKEFPARYIQAIDDPTVGVKIARMNLVADPDRNPSAFHLMLFHRRPKPCHQAEANRTTCDCQTDSFSKAVPRSCPVSTGTSSIQTSKGQNGIKEIDSQTSSMKASKEPNGMEWIGGMKGMKGVKGMRGMRVVSVLRDDAGEMGWAARMAYKWVFPETWAQRFRYWLERRLNKPLDWSRGSTERNELLHESATSLAVLDSAIVDLQQTHILQEFFVPVPFFRDWIHAFGALLSSWRNKSLHSSSLLNLTVRYVRADTITFLSYAPTDRYAFVLYYRVSRVDPIPELEDIHRALVGLTLSLGGTFYLPYRHHYSHADLVTAYPALPRLCRLATLYDPDHRFQNQWTTFACMQSFPTIPWPLSSKVILQPLENPPGPSAPSEAPVPEQKMLLQTLPKDPPGPAAESEALVPEGKTDPPGPGAESEALVPEGKTPEWKTLIQTPLEDPPGSAAESEAAVPGGKTPLWVAVSIVATEKEVGLVEPLPVCMKSPMWSEPLASGSLGNVSYFRALAGGGCLALRELELFYRQVFVLVPEDDGRAVAERARWFVKEGYTLGDRDLYDELGRYAASRLSPVYRQYREYLALKRQKDELSAEITRLVRVINRGRPLENILSIGDGGRYTTMLRDTGAVSGLEYILNDRPAGFLERHLRSSWLRALWDDLSASFLQVDWLCVQTVTSSLSRIPDSSLELAVTVIGLHHFSDNVLESLLSGVARTLKPGGLFIIREHDARPELVPLLHVAHFSFNAFTGVPYEEELRDQSIRRFRPLSCWRQMLAAHDLHDTWLSERQLHDPTINVLAAFRKANLS